MNVLVIEDSEADYFLLCRHLQQGIPDAEVWGQVEGVNKARQVLQHQSFDVILLDLHLTDTKGEETLDAIAPIAGQTPVIILSGLDDERLSLSLLQKGAQDYIRKDQVSPAAIRKSILHSIERQQMASSLSQLAEKYQHVLQASVDIVFDYAPAKNALQVDRIEQHGKAIYDFEGKTPAGLLRPMASDVKVVELEKLFQQLMASDLTQYRQKLALEKEGEVYDIELVCNLSRTANGNVVRMVGSFADIGALEKASREAHAARMQYNHLFSNSPAPSFLCDRETLTILDCSESAVATYGFSKAHLQSLMITDLWHASELVAVTKQLLVEEFDLLKEKYHRHRNAAGKTITVSVEIIRSSLYNREVFHLIVFDQSEKLALERRLAKEKLEAQRKLSQSIIEAQEGERTRIGQELHDNVNQMLTSALLYLGMDDPPCLKAVHSKAKEIVKKSIDEIRGLSHQLVTPVITDLGLVDALNEFVGHLNACQAIQFWVSVDSLPSIDQAFALNLYRIVQEQANNTIKYSNGKTCWIQLSANENEVVLTLEDDGKGPSEKTKNGIGLQNIHNRAQLYGGSVYISKGSMDGFRMQVFFPMKKDCSNGMF